MSDLKARLSESLFAARSVGGIRYVLLNNGRAVYFDCINDVKLGFSVKTSSNPDAYNFIAEFPVSAINKELTNAVKHFGQTGVINYQGIIYG